MTHPLPEISIIAQDLQNLTLHEHMQDNAYTIDCLVCGKPYDHVIYESGAVPLQ